MCCRALNQSYFLGLNELYLNCSRLQLRTFHLYNNLVMSDLQSLNELYQAACSVIESMNRLDVCLNLTSYCTSYLGRMTMLAAFTLLKLSKSSFARFFNKGNLKISYFSAISLTQRISVQNNDLPAKTAQVLTQLWTSKALSSEEGGSEVSLALRIRTRLSMSLVHDCLWWWREEFGGRPRLNPVGKYASHERSESWSLGHPAPR